MKLDLKSRQCNAFRAMILQWLIRETFNLRLGIDQSIISYTCHNHFMHHNCLNLLPALPVWQWLKCWLPEVFSKPQHYMTVGKERSRQTLFVTFYPPHFHLSARLISQEGILSSMCFQSGVFLKLPFTTEWWNTRWRWCDEEWGMYMQVLPWSRKIVCVCNSASHELLW